MLMFSLREDNSWNLIVRPRVNDNQRIDGQYWLATNQGLYIVSQDNQILKNYTTETTPNLASNVVTTIAAPIGKSVWLGTDDGLTVFNREAETTFSITQNNYMHVGLNSRYIIKIFQDSNQSLWLGTLTAGIFQFHEQFSSIKHFKNIYGSVFSSTDNNVWVISTRS